jgi:hypothetical protein
MAPAGQIVKDFTIARVNLIPGAHAIIQRMRQGTTLLLARDPNDAYDPNAIMVIHPAPGSKRKIGYLPLGLAKELAPLMDAGVKVIARKANNPLYGVCQCAWIPPAPTETAELQVPVDTQVSVESATIASDPAAEPQ